MPSPGNPNPHAATRFGGPNAPRGNMQGAARAPAGRRGRPPALVRESFRLAFDKQLDFLKKIVVCDKSVKRKVEIVAPNGAVVTISVEPTIAERIRAVEVMGKFSGVQTSKAEDEEALPRSRTGYDLSKLTSAQLEAFEQLLIAAAEPEPVAVIGNVEVHELEEDDA